MNNIVKIDYREINRQWGWELTALKLDDRYDDDAEVWYLAIGPGFRMTTSVIVDHATALPFEFRVLGYGEWTIHDWSEANKLALAFFAPEALVIK